MDAMNKRELKFWGKVLVDNDCWLWTGGHKEDGYGRFYYQGKYYKAHRVAWELTKGPIPEGAAVRHTCSNYNCMRPGHMTIDPRLSAKDVLKIRARLQDGESCKLLAEDYSISLNSIYDIRKRRTWKSI